ncbi:MAG TPA: hypothetical protein VFN67_29600 [Polyangiales bacterium]|nr:hypothetical protein [Polyangiales bacterium]
MKGTSMNKDTAGKCQMCGLEDCAVESHSLVVSIEKGHVRRASEAADQVFAAASADKVKVESGVVFMTAILLIERLAKIHGCDPSSIIHNIAGCFDFKAKHMHVDKPLN